MKANGGGVILNMASIAGSAGLADRFAYSMSKGAVIAMTYSVARDYLASKIRCNCISPARVHTPFVDNYLRKAYPGTRSGKCSRSCRRRNPSAEWRSPTKSLRWRYFCARTKRPLLPAWTIRLMEDFSISTAEPSPLSFRSRLDRRGICFLRLPNSRFLARECRASE